MSNHASKSRFIIPGLKGFSSEDASWISAGATSFVHVPYRLRISHRRLPLSGSLVGGLVDRALAGFKCLLEQGVEPLARLIWAAQLRQQPGRSPQRAPPCGTR